jgi:regulator of replication initiation timing
MDDRILWDIIDRLRDELNIAQDGITDLNDVVRDLQAERDVLQAERDRLMSQVGSDSHNNSSTHTHTIKKEIAEYMHHNPDSMGARLFLIPCDEFNDGERDGTIYWEDGME